MPQESFAAVEATVTSKGQITLPREVRKRMGLHQGSRIRFSMPSNDEARMEAVRYSIQDVWAMADEGGKAGGVLSFEAMNAAKVRPRT